jgi:hypothetical protein
VIPTAYRAKIPKTLSYPVEAKDISDALAGVPQEELLKISFQFLNHLAHRHGTSVPYPVLTVKYRGRGRLPTYQYSYFLNWGIEVHAVPRRLRHLLRGKLIAETLPKIKDWLSSNAHSNEREGYHELTFTFDELKNELAADETSTPEWQTERV